MAAVVLGFLQAARDRLAQARHLHALFALVVGSRRSANLDRRSRGSWRGSRGTRRDRGQHVALGDAAVLAGSADARRIDAALGRETADGGP
jgi:hypothetical protein